MTELEAFVTGLNMVDAHNLLPLETETDMTGILEYLEHPQPTYNCIIAICRLTMKKLVSQVVRHSFRQAKKVANIFWRLGSKLIMTKMPHFLLTPPEAVEASLIKAYQVGALSTKLVVWSTCNKLARLGNLSVISSTSSNNVTSA